MLGLLKPTLYVRISSQRISIRNVKTGEFLSEPPELAIERQPKARVVAVGSEAAGAASPSVTVVNPFDHPRTLVSDFTGAEQLLRHLVPRVHRASLLAVAPRVVMHPLEKLEGGLTQVEIRAFREMALGGAGASEALVWQGRELTDEELRAATLPADGVAAE